MSPRNNAAAQAAAQRERERQQREREQQQRERERQQREREQQQRQREQAQREREREQAQRERERQQRERQQREREQQQRQREQAQRERERQQAQAQRERERQQAQAQRERQQAQAQREREAAKARERQAAETARAKAAAQQRIDAAAAQAANQATPASKTLQDAKNLTQALRIAGEGGVTKQELEKITKQFDAPANKVIQRLDEINKNLKAKDQAGINLNSGAANMVIKAAQNQPIFPGVPQADFGKGQIGKALQSMIGTPGYTAPRNPQSGAPYGGSRAAVPGTGMMIGGTMIRPGGRVAVRPMGAAPAIGDTNVTGGGDQGGGDQGGGDQGGGDQGGGDQGGGDGFDYQSILDAIAGLQQPEFDMSALTDMFNTQFEQLSSQFETGKPLQLAQLGRAYGGDAIRARQRMRKTTRDYRRGLPAQAFGQALANLAIGGGLTL